MAKLIPFATGDYDLIPVALEDGLIKYPSKADKIIKVIIVLTSKDGLTTTAVMAAKTFTIKLPK